MRTIAIAALALSASLAGAADQGAPVKDVQLGLSKTSVFDVPSPPAYKAEDGAPGERKLSPRLSPELPPSIPHAIADFTPITQSANACIDCHEVPGPKKAGEPTPLPRSHYVDWRHDQGKRLEKHSGARWICTACHVPRTDAKPLVVNRFKP